MDKIINSHVDKMESIEEEISLIIDEAMFMIDIDSVMESPNEVLVEVAGFIRSKFLNHLAPKAVENGIQLGKTIKKKVEQDKTIKVDDSKDPTLNDRNQSSKQD